MNPFHKTTIGRPKKWLIDAAADIGLDYSELSHEVTNDFKAHVEKRHGQGVLAITDKDFEKIPEIIRKPDLAIIGTYPSLKEGVEIAKLLGTTAEYLATGAGTEPEGLNDTERKLVDLYRKLSSSDRENALLAINAWAGKHDLR